MILFEDEKRIEINSSDWILASDLFIKWGYDVEQQEIQVIDMDDITRELKVWGIPFKWNL